MIPSCIHTDVHMWTTTGHTRLAEYEHHTLEEGQ